MLHLLLNELESAGIVATVAFPEIRGTSKVHNVPHVRVEFQTAGDALSYRTETGCGGWVLGRFLFSGSAWTPSSVILNAPGVSGVLLS
jgi:hypothetical protein